MTAITSSPLPPYRAVERCLGHAFGYGTCWEVVDQNDHMPRALLDQMDENTLVDEQWCREQARRLNREYAIGLWHQVIFGRQGSDDPMRVLCDGGAWRAEIREAADRWPDPRGGAVAVQETVRLATFTARRSGPQSWTVFCDLGDDETPHRVGRIN